MENMYAKFIYGSDKTYDSINIWIMSESWNGAALLTIESSFTERGKI